ncbi:MAG: hypothetical protein IJ600_12705 [Lachnospiraceae bacterium]|nr:hypothetical protein [Lachnospiraceae bacterium]
MSKATSGLFQGTIGHKNRNTAKIEKNNATQNRRHVVLWAQEKVKELANISNRQREKFNTARKKPPARIVPIHSRAELRETILDGTKRIDYENIRF